MAEKTHRNNGHPRAKGPMPAIFFGHGNPMNALAHNEWTEAWEKIGKTIPRPKGILSISAHWYVPGTMVTTAVEPLTIHDFGGFPRELYAVDYPAPGMPELAARVKQELLAGLPVPGDGDWGLDHGTWAVLRHVFPEANVPVVQLSIDATRPPGFHYELGKRLAPLRDEGILVMGSGNLVHNLHVYAWGERRTEPFDWALRFEEQARTMLMAGDDEPLVEYQKLGRDALLSAPTPDHYLPLLYVIALRRPRERLSFPVQGIDGGSVSMLAVALGM
jgi:4,5-DOPA dioxygenase extradiol